MRLKSVVAFEGATKAPLRLGGRGNTFLSEERILSTRVCSKAKLIVSRGICWKQRFAWFETRSYDSSFFLPVTPLNLTRPKLRCPRAGMLPAPKLHHQGCLLFPLQRRTAQPLSGEETIVQSHELAIRGSAIVE